MPYGVVFKPTKFVDVYCSFYGCKTLRWGCAVWTLFSDIPSWYEKDLRKTQFVFTTLQPLRICERREAIIQYNEYCDLFSACTLLFLLKRHCKYCFEGVKEPRLQSYLDMNHSYHGKAVWQTPMGVRDGLEKESICTSTKDTVDKSLGTSSLPSGSILLPSHRAQ